MEPGPVLTIFISPASRLPMKQVDSVQVHTGGGLVGDRYENSRHRHISLFSTGEMTHANERYGQTIPLELTRRNVLVDTGLLPRAPGTLLSLGPLELQVVRDAAPCKMLDMEIGDGAKTAMRRRAGVICRVLQGGQLQVGDMLTLKELDNDLLAGSSEG